MSYPRCVRVCVDSRNCAILCMNEGDARWEYVNGTQFWAFRSVLYRIQSFTFYSTESKKYEKVWWKKAFSLFVYHTGLHNSKESESNIVISVHCTFEQFWGMRDISNKTLWCIFVKLRSLKNFSRILFWWKVLFTKIFFERPKSITGNYYFCSKIVLTKYKWKNLTSQKIRKNFNINP